MSATCPACDAALPGAARFCPACGQAIGFAPAPSPAAASTRTPSAPSDPAYPPTLAAGHAPTAPRGTVPYKPSRPPIHEAPTPALDRTPLGPDRAPRSGPLDLVPLPPMRLLPGTKLSVYRIESAVGEGGMGVVYRAHDEARGRTVALKCLHTNLAGDPEIRRRFEREARVLGAYNHPNVVKVYDFVEHEHILAIVMEFVAGQSLVAHLARWRGRIPFAEIRGIFGAVLDAVGHGHDRGVVHRDLKPDNILVVDTPGGLVPKVVDFGIAKILEGTTYTMTGALLGTCRYMSPEQVQHPDRADRRSDIYSLGITLYQLVTGAVPFDQPNHFSVMMAHVHDAPRPPAALRDDLPPALGDLILDAIAKDPAARPESCAAFRARLDEALAAFAPPVPSTARPSSLSPKDAAEMILVPGGPFAMGPDRRVVHLDGFYIDRTPVTNQAFATFMDITGYRPDNDQAARFLHHFRAGKVPPGLEDHPVVYVSWDDARAYAAWAGKRLPSEAEWEKAARGADGRKYPWGSEAPGPTHANYGNLRGKTTPVGMFPRGASPYGVLDMSGNVWEWCEDVDDAAFYADGPSHNPRNTRREARSHFVMRGGSWLYGPRALRTFSRTGYEAHYRFAGGGFRCAQGG